MDGVEGGRVYILSPFSAPVVLKLGNEYQLTAVHRPFCFLSLHSVLFFCVFYNDLTRVRFHFFFSSLLLTFVSLSPLYPAFLGVIYHYFLTFFILCVRQFLPVPSFSFPLPFPSLQFKSQGLIQFQKFLFPYFSLLLSCLEIVVLCI